MKDREHFTHRIDMWDADGNEIIEHLANVEDFEVAMATYHAACLRWPTGRITLQQDGRVTIIQVSIWSSSSSAWAIGPMAVTRGAGDGSASLS